MFSSKKAILDVTDVPSKWIFEKYLSITTKLDGQDIKMISVFNPRERTPSLCIYVDSKTKQYKFKCFSTGIGGTPVDLVMNLYSLNFMDASIKIIKDYLHYLETNTYDVKPVVPKDKWKIGEYIIRHWNKDDVEFWSPYNIGAQLLNHYNVKPLQSFTMNRGDESFTRTGKRMYGYFDKNGLMYRIYLPGSTTKKFMIFSDYIQGWDQIRNKKRLFICSSLKDIMAMRSLGIDGDYIAPNSENSNIKNILEWVKAYDQKYVIFDNDEAGVKMMNKYKTMYDIPFIHLPLSKDISDSIRDHGANKVKEYLKEYL